MFTNLSHCKHDDRNALYDKLKSDIVNKTSIKQNEFIWQNVKLKKIIAQKYGMNHAILILNVNKEKNNYDVFSTRNKKAIQHIKMNVPTANEADHWT